MKKISFLIALLSVAISFSINAQADPAQRLSPPATTKASLENANIIINYSQPSVRGREIWGELVPYGKIWRTGANEATTFETDRDIIIAGEKLPAGKYALFTIPEEKEWTIIFNSEWDQWGSFKYDPAKDVLRVKATSFKAPGFTEKMTFDISDNNVVLLWENLQLIIPVKS